MIIKRPVRIAALTMGIVMLVRHRRGRRHVGRPPTGAAAGPSSTTGPAAVGPEPFEIGLEVPRADAVEQHQTVVPEADDDDEPAGVPWEVPEADLLDQRRNVGLDDELRADDTTDRSIW